MCGIAGVASPAVGASLPDGVLDTLRARGPDGDGRVARPEAPSFELLHTRLAIVDLSDAGNQPMANEDGSLVMVFNGEIYNSPELRRECVAKGHRFRSRMDGEVILHLWEMEGPSSLLRLNGIFSVALADTRTGVVTLARDPLGVKPLFYAVDGVGRLWFASEPRLVALAAGQAADVDLVALAQFLSFLWVPAPRTPYRGVSTLLPGHYLRWMAGKLTVTQFSEPFIGAPSTDSAPDDVLVAEAAERIGDAARRQLLADVPVGLMASGGVDSGLIWSATKETLSRAYCVTWDDAGDSEALHEDRRAVGKLQSQFGTPVEYMTGSSMNDVVLPPSGDLLADPAYELTRQIAQAARANGLKVLLCGQGGDELFAGYRRHSVAPILAWLRVGVTVAGAAERTLRRLPGAGLSREYAARLMRAAGESSPFDAYMQLCTYSTARERAAALDCTEREVASDVVWQAHREAFDAIPPDLPFLRKVLALDLAVYLPGLGLTYMDRAGMEFGVEIRVPLLDLDLVRWAMTLPDEALRRRGRGKWLLRQVAAHALGPELAHRPKRAFAAPANTVAASSHTTGERGFRQGSYFARATRVLDAHLSRASVS